MSIRFLNVDLEVESDQELSALVSGFGDRVLDLYCGPVDSHHRATLELDMMVSDPDSAILHFCKLIESLEGGALGLWEKSFSRVFDIGYRSGHEPRCYESDLRSETIKKVAKLGASIRVTIYPPDEPGPRPLSGA